MKYRKPEVIYRERAAEMDFCSLTGMPSHLVRILILIEDFSFMKHHGIQPKAILEALWLNLQTGKIRFGGSTITQQICKNLYFGCDQSFRRKLSEMMITLYMEKNLSKQQILELYLNCVYFDNGTYGIKEAARYYFDETPAELTFRQCFMLISLLPVVGKYNPLVYPEEFYKYMMNNAAALHRKQLISDEEMAEVRFRGPECLDEKLRKPDESTKKYAVHGPFINERYGPFPAILEEEKAVICTVCGEAMHASDTIQKAIAHVIVNRIGYREWCNFHTAEDIVKYTGFVACELRSKHFKEAETYLEERCGDERFERVIRNVLPVLRKEEEDFTQGCVLFYSPWQFFLDQMRTGDFGKKAPDWDFSILEKVKFHGLEGDFKFYRYKSDADILENGDDSNSTPKNVTEYTYNGEKYVAVKGFEKHAEKQVLPDNCTSTAWCIGLSMITGKKYDATSKPYWGDDGARYVGYKHAFIVHNVFGLAYKEILNGKPTMLYACNYNSLSGKHAVTIVGFADNITDRDSLLPNSFLVIDPADGEIKNLSEVGYKSFNETYLFIYKDGL